jgi:CBS-domain-containing membrane protein
MPHATLPCIQAHQQQRWLLVDPLTSTSVYPYMSCSAVCCSILVVSVTDHFLWQEHGFHLLVASFGASAVLLYGVPESKLAQPRNLIGAQQQHVAPVCIAKGTAMSAVVGRVVQVRLCCQ